MVEQFIQDSDGQVRGVVVHVSSKTVSTTVRVWVPVFVRTGSIVVYWREPGLRHLAGAAVLTFVVCIVALCSLFILMSQYIMWVHLAN